MAFQHHPDRQLIVRKFSCVDNNRIFVEPTYKERSEQKLDTATVFNIDDLTTPDDIVYVDIASSKVFIYRKK